MALIIVAVLFSALPISWKLVVVSPLLVNLLIDWDDFTLNLMKEGNN